jgi:hypothetical protein
MLPSTERDRFAQVHRLTTATASQSRLCAKSLGVIKVDIQTITLLWYLFPVPTVNEAHHNLSGRLDDPCIDICSFSCDCIRCFAEESFQPDRRSSYQPYPAFAVGSILGSRGAEANLRSVPSFQSRRPHKPGSIASLVQQTSAVRHCSYRRHNMCKLHGGIEADAGGLDVTKGREILPADVIPRHYDLTLEPDFNKHTYDGHVIIDLDVVEDTSSISLNTLELTIHQTKILSEAHEIR